MPRDESPMIKMSTRMENLRPMISVRPLSRKIRKVKARYAASRKENCEGSRSYSCKMYGMAVVLIVERYWSMTATRPMKIIKKIR
jgi:hypothetical protein